MDAISEERIDKRVIKHDKNMFVDNRPRVPILFLNNLWDVKEPPQSSKKRRGCSSKSGVHLYF